MRGHSVLSDNITHRLVSLPKRKTRISKANFCSLIYVVNCCIFKIFIMLILRPACLTFNTVKIYFI